ncbi:MAG: hypothetical protein ACRD7E_11155 [Bryobacteraceae bacterium]
MSFRLQVGTALPADWVRPARSDFRVEGRRKEIKQGLRITPTRSFSPTWLARLGKKRAEPELLSTAKGGSRRESF